MWYVSFSIKKTKTKQKTNWLLKESEMQFYSPSESLMWHQSWISEPKKEGFENSGMTEHKANVCDSGVGHS